MMASMDNTSPLETARLRALGTGEQLPPALPAGHLVGSAACGGRGPGPRQRLSKGRGRNKGGLTAPIVFGANFTLRVSTSGGPLRPVRMLHSSSVDHIWG